ncbi:glycosyltransferase family 4 protein [Chitinispirillales bacterium ANBcel5]|uniref:glycosyltransferase family 4 protein n=1 Tax=Cellulosispirillum alkaliphilum TaxID=3039283 RepID=UPI002A588A5F|nr:glycosyltransferase family 4 protein [Chitinispirillales bacterium ANBcel5]
MKKNSLDGITLLRFSHSFEQGGGVEEYLQNLNKILLCRNKMTIIQMHLSNDIKPNEERTEFIGKGTLIKVALKPTFERTNWNSLNKNKRSNHYKQVVKQVVRNSILYNPFLEKILTKYRRKYRIANIGIQAINAPSVCNRILETHPVDLIVLHSMGGEDTSQVIDISINKKIPYIYINHFNNSRFQHSSVREQIRDAAGISGVSSVKLPKYLKRKFVPVYDAVDTEFYYTDNAKEVDKKIDGSVIFLPARISPNKGHGDMIHLLGILKKREVNTNMVFAGRLDSSEFVSFLKEQITANGLENRVFFVGECNAKQLRDWYNRSDILVLPSRSEGFPRVVLESQAMQRPVVAYDVGGVSEALKVNKSGYVCDYGDIEGLAHKVTNLLFNESLKKSFGKCGREFVLENFNLTRLAQRHESFYLKAMKESSYRKNQMQQE